MGFKGDLYRTARRALTGSPGLVRRLDLLRFEAAVRTDPLLRTMVERIPERSVILDIGAGVGLYAVTLARRINGAQVHAFEASPSTFRQLEASVALHSLDAAVTLYPTAVGERSGDQTMFLSSDPGRSSLREYNAQRVGNHVENTVTVPCSTLDELVGSGRCPAPDVLKIDVEGLEWEVVMGAAETIRTHRPAIYFDAHAREDPARRAPAIMEHLEAVGYRFEGRHPNFFASTRPAS